uniref:uncharacterized protein At5g19025 n=1 Tax=Erigeron canadensis TaxID=72917 RepID=UPI001CB96C36|nr:uncharacterized protein At5g19025 [Erigeron canadensis]
MGHNHHSTTSMTTTKRPSNTTSSNNNTCTHNNHHHNTPSATLDILILTLTLFSGAFLISSYFNYIFHSLSLILPPLSLSISISQTHIVFFSVFFVISLTLTLIVSFSLCQTGSRKCGKKGCKGLKKAMEFDLQLQSEEMLRSGKVGGIGGVVDDLPWKGGSETNPDYECLRSELRKMAPVNGRAVLLFRLKCGCPVAKLEGWGPKRGRRNKKSLSLN